MEWVDASMTARELQAWLKSHFPVENERHEWKGWRNLRNNVSSHDEDLLSYVSAFANMDGGCIVIGVQDKTLAVQGIEQVGDYTPENLPNRILGKTYGLPSVGLRVEVKKASDTGAEIWLVHVPRHAPRQPVQAHGKAWQRDGDSLVPLRSDRLQAILSEPLAGHDWSANAVAEATLADLDPRAVAKAREKFGQRYQRESWAAEIAGWSNAEFLDRAKITRHGAITHTALLLLGKPESVGLIAGGVAEITWKVPAERVAKHFGPPFLLTTTEVGEHIRNPNIKLFPASELLAIELPRYDTKVILEGLHNCIAHQDYEQAARVVVLETTGQLQLRNRGRFVDGKPEDYLTGGRTPDRYRNSWLATAMNNVGMIDKVGFGIQEMVAAQRKRYLPLPDYESSTATETVLNIYGQTIDENYSRVLMERTNLPLEQVVWLDRVQKKHRVGVDQATVLRKAGLIEGRKPNVFVSAVVAKITNTQNQYVLNKGFDDELCKLRILDRLKLSPATGDELNELILKMLPAVLDEAAKQTKVKNLRTALRLRGLSGVFIEVDPSGPARGAGAIWRIKPSNIV